MEILSKIPDIVFSITWRDIIDILFIAIFVFFFILVIKRAKATQVTIGILIIFSFYVLSSIFNLIALSEFLKEIIKYGIFALLIAFSDEIKAYFVSLSELLKKKKSYTTEEALNEVVESVFSLSRKNIGAIIVFEKETQLDDISKSGIEINAKVSIPLIETIFYPKTPLHDGAVIISKDIVKYARVTLPIGKEIEAKRDYGTRHLAAIGVSKITDSIVVVVSEETGMVSVAKSGELERGFKEESLKEFLIKELFVEVSE